MGSAKEAEALLNLPFDQYSRQKIVADIINSAIRSLASHTGPLNIIDLGGHKGHTKDFLPQDKLTILDLYDETYEGYVKGDATKTDFADKSFDVAVSYDTFEHIPPQLRKAFILEGIRISDVAFIVAAPFDAGSGSVSHVEQLANEVYKDTKGQDHPWLKEHLENGAPKTANAEAWLKEADMYWCKLPTNNLALWLLTQDLMFNATGFSGDVKEVVDVSRFYNQHLSSLEALAGTPYRYVFIMSRHKEVIEVVEKYLHSVKVDAESKSESSMLDYIGRVGRAYAAMLVSLHKDVEYLKVRETHLQNEYDRVARANQALAARLSEASE